MQQRFTANPGTSLTSIQLYNATPILGVVVDNPTGGWLYIVELRDYVPPYTLQWSRDLEYAGSAISVVYGSAPSGQVSTNQGDPYTVTLDSGTVGASAGVPSSYIQQFTQSKILLCSHTYSAGSVVNTLTQQSTTEFFGTTKRARIRQIILEHINLTGTMALITPITGNLIATVNGQAYTLTLGISGKRIRDELLFNPVLDCDPGQDITLSQINPSAASLDASWFSGGIVNFSVNMIAIYESI